MAKEKQLRCPKCKKYHVQAQAVFDVKNETNKHGCGYALYILLGGWVLEIILAIPKALFKKRKLSAKTRTYAVCQDCGYTWEIKTK